MCLWMLWALVVFKMCNIGVYVVTYVTLKNAFKYNINTVEFS